jgi:predicted metal-binding membrane protein
MTANQNSLLAAGILFLAGFYQFMPIKKCLLDILQNPDGFFIK